MAGREQEIRALGEALWQRMEGEVPGVFDTHHWQARVLDWAMRDITFRNDLFHLIDVLPALNTSRQISRHVREYLLKEGRELPKWMDIAIKAASRGLTARVAANVFKKNVTSIARRFIAGEDPQEALKALRTLHEAGMGFSVDLVGEETLSEVEASRYQQRYHELINQLARSVAAWPAQSRLDRNHVGMIPRANVSLKLSALDPDLDILDLPGAVERLTARALPLFLAAREQNVFINVDLESWDLHDICMATFEEILRHSEMKGWPHVGIVIQAYLKSAPQDFERLLAFARRRAAPLTIRLVKGAYWDQEVSHCAQTGTPCPVLTDKGLVDRQFEYLSQQLLANSDHLWPAFASHNLRSLSYAIATAEEMKISKSAYEVQMLYGMAESERRAFCEAGHRVRVYAPVGDLLPGMAYLVRRLLENTANNSFLRMGFREKEDLGRMMQAPQVTKGEASHPQMRHDDLISTFENCPYTDFTDAQARHAFARQLEIVHASLPRTVTPFIAGKRIKSPKRLVQRNPADPQQAVTLTNFASAHHVDRALAHIKKTWMRWRQRPLEERALLLEHLADRLEEDRMHLAALEVYEVGKPWREADADVVEAIDFCRYYARQALRELSDHDLHSVAGEENRICYEGRGPTAVIAPWNFPIAILCGMSVAALVAGNPVIIKPAEQAGACAQALYEHMIAAGIPSDVIHLLPGLGDDVGAALVSHPDIVQIAFTGSQHVGLSMMARVARYKVGQRQVKKLVCEMGGKNAVIIDDDADLDEAVRGTLTSAFAYSGQKCSAASRVIVLESIYDAFVSRLVEATRSLRIRQPEDPACQMGPVIDETAYQRLQKESEKIMQLEDAGIHVLYRGKVTHQGYYIAPLIFAVSDVQHPLMQRELFGPLLAVTPAHDFAEALQIANASAFGLTGAVYSRTPSHLEQARQQLVVGNLYLNRQTTGARVGRQPFGGLRLSGVGAKAGGSGYLRQFVQTRVVTENTLRHGFSPES